MKLKTALELGRVSNLPTVWTNVLAGMLLTGEHPAPRAAGMLLLAMSCFYVGGMYLNDLFDRAIDARERPERPIPSGQVTARTVGIVGTVLLGLGLALTAGTAWLSPQASVVRALAAAALLAAAILFYDVHHKQNPWSPLVMGLCRVLVYAATALALVDWPPMQLWFGAGILWCYLIGLTYVARQENLRRFTHAWPLVLLAAPFLYASPQLSSPTTIGLWLYFLVWVLWALSYLRRERPSFSIPRAVTSLIAGISLLDGLLISMLGYHWEVGLAVLGFVATRAAQRVIAGT